MSDVQQQLMSVNRQYNHLGEILAAHQRELLSVQSSLANFHKDFKQHLHWLDAIDTSVVPLSEFTGSSDKIKAKILEQQASFYSLVLLFLLHL